jgi:hypothetical protein
MAQEIGRNDPCPCGSGRKYKQCCLRKAKQAGLSAKRVKSASSSKTALLSWNDRFEAAFVQGRDLRRSDQKGAMQFWLSGWQQLQQNLSDDVATIDAAQQALDRDQPDIREWVLGMFRIWRSLVPKNEASAAQAAAFAEEFLARFHREPAGFRRIVQAELAYFLGQDGRMSEATEICRGLIAEQPDNAQGYCALADVFLAADPPEAGSALETLEEAANHPVKNAEDFSLKLRIEDARESLRTQKVRASEYYMDWDEFWSDFEDAKLDRKLQMTRERIENAPDFDEEWVFSLMIEGLMKPCQEKRRGADWIEVLELLRDKRAEFVAPESGVLGAYAVEFALADKPEYLDSAVELLFDDPAESIDHILPELEFLAYAGAMGADATGVLDELVDGWPALNESGGLMPSAYSEWAEWTLTAQMATWADADIDRPRSIEEVKEVLGAMLEQLDVAGVELSVNEFLGPGPAQFDAAAASNLDEDHDTASTLSRAFMRSLVDERGWPACKALLAGSYLSAFLEHQAQCEDPFQDEYATRESKKSNKFHNALKALRDLWREDSPFAPHPDLAVGWAKRITQQGLYGKAEAAAAFFEAVVHLTPWLEERGFIKNPELSEAIQEHFTRRFAEVALIVMRLTDQHPVVEKSLDETERWLNG